MSKQISILASILVVLVTVSIYSFFKRPAPKIHYHAGFLIYVDGQLQDFSLSKYMETAPCYLDESKHPPVDSQKEKAHLHDNVGDVVHVHHSGSTWGDLFKNIGFSFPATESATGFINGSPINNILTHPIQSYDSVIILSGNSNDVDISRYVSLSHIKEVESQSETCGSSHD